MSYKEREVELGCNASKMQWTQWNAQEGPGGVKGAWENNRQGI